MIAGNLQQQLPALLKRKQFHAISGNRHLAFGPDRKPELHRCHEVTSGISIAD